MSAPTLFKQVVLARGNNTDIAWIEERGARVGASVELKSTGEFWIVTDVFGFTKTQAEVQEDGAAHKNHRKRTDI